MLFSRASLASIAAVCSSMAKTADSSAELAWDLYNAGCDAADDTAGQQNPEDRHQAHPPLNEVGRRSGRGAVCSGLWGMVPNRILHPSLAAPRVINEDWKKSATPAPLQHRRHGDQRVALAWFASRRRLIWNSVPRSFLEGPAICLITFVRDGMMLYLSAFTRFLRLALLADQPVQRHLHRSQFGQGTMAGQRRGGPVETGVGARPTGCGQPPRPSTDGYCTPWRGRTSCASMTMPSVARATLRSPMRNCAMLEPAIGGAQRLMCRALVHLVVLLMCR